MGGKVERRRRERVRRGGEGRERGGKWYPTLVTPLTHPSAGCARRSLTRLVIIIVITYFSHECNSHFTVVQKAITMGRNGKAGLNAALTAAAHTHMYSAQALT